MAQVKIFALASRLRARRHALSEVIHSCVVEALQFPPDKRFHRFFPLAKDDFVYPGTRSQDYTILEISLFEGRTVEAKKALIGLLFHRFATLLGIRPDDLEITLFETPRANWGIRGKPADELDVGYRVDV